MSDIEAKLTPYEKAQLRLKVVEIVFNGGSQSHRDGFDKKCSELYDFVVDRKRPE